MEGSGWNFCTQVAFRQRAVWRGRRSLPPRVGVVKPDKRRRATLGGGDMPKAIRAHLLLFPRTREHLKPTLTPPDRAFAPRVLYRHAHLAVSGTNGI